MRNLGLSARLGPFNIMKRATCGTTITCNNVTRVRIYFPTDATDLHRCRSGCFLFPTDATDLHRMPFWVMCSHRSRPWRGRCHRSRSGASCFPADCADLHRCRSGRADPTDAVRVFLVSADCVDADTVRVLLVSPQIAPLAPRSKREFCYNVTCYMLQ